MPISSFSNPIPEIIQGLLQGHKMAMDMHQQQQNDQKFKTDQMLANQQMSANTIMQQMHQQDMDSKDAANARDFDRYTNPISNGMVQDRMNATIPGAPGSPGPAPGEAPDVNNLPTNQGPSLPTSYDYMRKADPGRTVALKDYTGKVIRQGETKTPDQQRDFDVNQKVQEANSFEEAKGRADTARVQAKRKADLLFENGGQSAPAGLEALGWHQGDKMTKDDIAKASQQMELLNKPTIVPKESTAYQPPSLFAPASPAGQSAQPGQNAAPANPNQTTVSMPGLTLPGQTATPAPQGQTGAPGAQNVPAGWKPVAQGAPKDLSEPEQLALSAAQRVAEVHHLPFDRMLNPQDPRAQIPTQYHAEMDGVIARAKTAPEVAEQLKNNRELAAGNAQDRKDNASNRRSDQSYALNTRELDKERAPIEDGLRRYSRLKDTFDQGTPQADALVAPELLSFMAGGQGSGLRMNQAQIVNTVGGRSVWEDIQAKVNKYKLDPTKALLFTPAQRKQIGSLMDVVGSKLKAKQGILDSAGSDLISYTDPADHRRVVDKARKGLTGIDQGGGQTGGGTVRYSSGGKTYNIPAAQEAEFLKDHPGAQK